MRVIAASLIGCVLTIYAEASTAWAKTMTIPKAGIQVAQLHEELLSQFPQWRGAQQADGSFTDPLLRMEHDEQQIILTVPDEADENAIRAVVAAHVPQPRPEMRRRTPAALEDRLRRIEDRLQLGE